jgi:hypothetical protein
MYSVNTHSTGSHFHNLPSTPRRVFEVVSFRFPHQNPVCISLPCVLPHAKPILLHCITLIISDEIEISVIWRGDHICGGVNSDFVQCRVQILEICHVFKGLISCLHAVTLSSILSVYRETFISKPPP